MVRPDRLLQPAHLPWSLHVFVQSKVDEYWEANVDEQFADDNSIRESLSEEEVSQAVESFVEKMREFNDQMGIKDVEETVRDNIERAENIDRQAEKLVYRVGDSSMSEEHKIYDLFSRYELTKTGVRP